mgnify:CR=1 FL=1
MKNKIITTIAACMILVLTASCLEKTYPSQGFTQEQLNESDSRLALLSAAVKRAMYYSYSSALYYNFGYPGLMVVFDAMGAETPIQSTSYDYLSWWEQGTYLGKSYGVCSEPWNFYYNLVQKTNLTLAVANPSLESSLDDLHRIGNALCYRALAYMDMTRLYEFKATGYPDLDDAAEYNVTVPIIDEYTSEQTARNNPRVPFYTMYRFIMNDLNKAEFYLQGYFPSKKNDAGIGAVYGMKARMWLEMGTRFEQKPEDLNILLAHEDDADLEKYDKLGIKTAQDCFEKARVYSEWAMSSYTPVTESQWYDLKSGFNTANEAWIWAIQYGEEDVSQTYRSLIGFLSPEAMFGVANNLYYANRMIDAKLYRKVPSSDWRYHTWIATEDAGTVKGYSNYKTLLSSDDWVGFNALTSFKFRPGSGNTDDYKVGNAVDIPLMRVEEMYLINAEATARTKGLSNGKVVLEKFLTNYRYNSGTSYYSTSTTLEEFIIEVLDQKRIEFWGEGIVFWDYKRTCRSVERDYSGSNHPEAFRFHSKDGYAAPWMNIVISQTEERYNSAIINNPDPSNYHE